MREQGNFSVTPDDLRRVQKNALTPEEAAKAADALRAKITRANFKIMEGGNEKVTEKITNETQEGIQELADLSQEELDAMKREFEK